MADDKLAELLKTQKSLTEWLEDIKHSDAAAIRKDDNEKRERLRVLNNIIDLPFDKPTQFEATELTTQNPTFATFLQTRGSELCALRLMPKKDGLPKLRMRGKTIADAYQWFIQQNLDPAAYRADFVPHPPDYSWATIFVVNKHGIQGEVVFGGHHQLTQGFHDHNPPMVFRYDFKKWELTPHNDRALAHLKKLAEFIHVPTVNKQARLQKELGATFVHNYLTGYFETTDSSMGTWFIDYSQALGKIFANTVIRPRQSAQALVAGQTGSPGKATGTVVIVPANNIANVTFPDGSVLVCEVTTPDYVPLMQKAVAIITDQGGILSHAAIVARELKKPCIVGSGRATSALKAGQTVTVDANKGTVTA